MGKLAAFLLILVGSTQSPVFVYALQTKAKPAIHLLQDLAQQQDQQDLPAQSADDGPDQSDDYKLPLCRIQVPEPLCKEITGISDPYLHIEVLQQNYAISTPPPEC
ncbi:MAG: hypothetical protein HYU70_15920 [Bacteroidetes bacterium]|nr:hypothetical protein [Bacteroidota bacterium]